MILTYRSGADGAQAVACEIQSLGRKAVALQLDVGDVVGFPAFVDQVRSVLNGVWERDCFDHLVNKAGHGEMTPFAGTTEAQFDLLFDVPREGRVLPHPGSAGGRRADRELLVGAHTRHLSRLFGLFRGQGRAVMTAYMATELGSRGVTVNTIAPGDIETDFLGGAVRDTPAYNEAFAAMTALGRVGTPDDIGPAVAGLLSSNNRWVTAQRIEVSGGQNIGGGGPMSPTVLALCLPNG